MSDEERRRQTEVLDRACIDLSDYSDEFVEGFVAGFEHHESGVDSQGRPFLRPLPIGGGEE